MADRNFESLIPRVSPSVKGCPHYTMFQYIRDAAIRTCERTLYWRYQIPTFNLLPGVYEYAYNKPVGTDVHAVFGAVVNDRPLDLLTLEQAIAAYPQWADLYSGETPATVWSLTPSSGFNVPEFNEDLFNDGEAYTLPSEVIEGAASPQAMCQLNGDQYILLPLPDANTYRMRMFVALKPKRSSVGMSEYTLDELEDVIVHGALQHLLTLPDTNWSDRELASYHAKQYLFHLTERRARANLGNMRGNITARFQPFG